MTSVEIGWLAGIIEGEGSLDICGNQPRISIAMTDFDVIHRLKSVTNMGHVTLKTQQKSHWKSQLYWRVTKRTDVLQLLYTVWPLLGERRRAKATELILHTIGR